MGPVAGHIQLGDHAQHTNADALSRKPDPDAVQKDGDAPGATRIIVNTGTQMVMDNESAVDTHTTTTPAIDISFSPLSLPDLQLLTCMLSLTKKPLQSQSVSLRTTSWNMG